MAETNQAFAASGVIPRVNVALHEEADYVEGVAQEQDLQRLTARTDGWLDHVHDLRDVYAADIVHLIFDRSPDEDVGIAWVPYEMNADSEGDAFGVSNWRAYNGLVAHELGHNMGLNHDRYVDPPIRNEPWPHSYGYVNQKAFEPNAAALSRWRTIMAYPSQCAELLSAWCTLLLRFSNPDQNHLGDPMGVAGDTPSQAVDGPADARRTLNMARTTIANWRPSSDRSRCLYRVKPDRVLALEAGGTWEFQVRRRAPRRRSRCAWTGTRSVT